MLWSGWKEKLVCEDKRGEGYERNRVLQVKAGEGFDSSENHPDSLEARGFRESTAEARSLITRLECGTIGSESHLVRMGGQEKRWQIKEVAKKKR